MSAPRVRFLIGGVQKAGTSALAQYLSRHPALRLPLTKEAHVFDAPDFDDSWTSAEVDARYAASLAAGDDDALHGDATPIYLLHPRFVERVARYNPGMRWIVLFREPVERALSQYHMERTRGDERWPLWPAMLLERWRLRGHHDDFRDGSPLRHHSYRRRGDYARQLDVLYANFPPDQVLLIRSAALLSQPATCIARACAFLGVQAPTADTAYPKVFEGSYAPATRGGPTWRLMRWLMRRELQSMRERYGLVFD